MPIACTDLPTDQLTAETSDACCLSLPGSYSFSSFHMRRTMAATRRAIVTLARLGLVPADNYYLRRFSQGAFDGPGDYGAGTGALARTPGAGDCSL